MRRVELEQFLSKLLQPQKFRDYAPNGVQIEGAERIEKIVTAVSASQAAIDFAIQENAQALLVHHGYFWKGEPAILQGLKRQRIASLLAHNINLIAYHLPLDQHERLGNNVLFSRNFECMKVWQSPIESLIWHAEINPISHKELILRLSINLRREAMSFGVVNEPITRVAWCTGAAQDYFSQAVFEGAQVFVSGEYAERTFHEANELQALYISCGHHASERAGIQSLGEYIHNELGLEILFFDEDNPL